MKEYLKFLLATTIPFVIFFVLFSILDITIEAIMRTFDPPIDRIIIFGGSIFIGSSVSFFIHHWFGSIDKEPKNEEGSLDSINNENHMTNRDKFKEVFREEPMIELCPFEIDCRECRYSKECDMKNYKPSFWRMEYNDSSRK